MENTHGQEDGVLLESITVALKNCRISGM